MGRREGEMGEGGGVAHAGCERDKVGGDKVGFGLPGRNGTLNRHDSLTDRRV